MCGDRGPGAHRRDAASLEQHDAVHARVAEELAAVRHDDARAAREVPADELVDKVQRHVRVHRREGVVEEDQLRELERRLVQAWEYLQSKDGKQASDEDRKIRLKGILPMSAKENKNIRSGAKLRDDPRTAERARHYNRQRDVTRPQARARHEALPAPVGSR